MPVISSPRPEAARHQYTARIIWTDADGKERITHWSGLLRGAIEAIYSVHRYAQREQETNADRKVVRPRLAPDEYRVDGLALTYMDMAGNEIREAVYVPNGRNPDLRKHRHPKPEQPALPLDDADIINQSQKAIRASVA